MTDAANPNLLCLHCGEQLTPHPTALPWLHCTACAHAYLPQDLHAAHEQRQRQQQRQDILDTLREQNRRRNSKSSSDGGPSKEDKLGSRTKRQANWGDDDGGQFLSWSKTEPKTEYLSVRGLPESVPAEAVMAAIEMELTDE
jgi:hypothetical protein